MSTTHTCEFFGLSEAAKRIGISAPTLKWHLLYGGLRDVDLRGPNNCRLFTPDDVERLRRVLGEALRQT